MVEALVAQTTTYDGTVPIDSSGWRWGGCTWMWWRNCSQRATAHVGRWPPFETWMDPSSPLRRLSAEIDWASSTSFYLPTEAPFRPSCTNFAGLRRNNRKVVGDDKDFHLHASICKQPQPSRVL